MNSNDFLNSLQIQVPRYLHIKIIQLNPRVPLSISEPCVLYVLNAIAPIDYCHFQRISTINRRNNRSSNDPERSFHSKLGAQLLLRFQLVSISDRLFSFPQRVPPRTGQLVQSTCTRHLKNVGST